jgi:nitrate/nitrite transporter NarK
MQVPAGLAIDRFGPRRALIAGISVLTLAQFGFALALTYPSAVIARVFIGGGDALIFTSVLRLVSSWFPVVRIPLVTQLTGQLGQIGAMAATVPMTLLLREAGWTPTFAAPAALGLVFVALLLLLVRDTPTRRTQAGAPIARRRVVSTVGEVWARSGTRMGFWVHFSTPFSGIVFALLWGYPFLVQAQAIGPITAGVLLLLATFFSMLSAPLIGQFVAYRPFHRSTLVLASLAAQMAVWAVALLWPGPAPLWLLVLLVAAIGVGGPVSMIGFDYARTSNPPAQLGGANGIVNQGGFIATVLAVLAIGLILDRLTPPGQAYGREAFAWAMSVQFVLWTIGAVQVARYRACTRREFHDLDAEAYERFRHHDLSVDWNLSVRPPSERLDD